MDQSRPHSALRTLSTTVPRALIRCYQLLTLGALRRCRFSPSCSEYFYQALLEWGLWKGMDRGTRRIIKCHPWHPGGYDPVQN